MAAKRQHPFDSYAPFTDLAALHAYSDRPLRKSVRVNTIKCSVEAFQAWAAQKEWSLTPVPWSPESFYVDRTVRDQALGRDLLHLLGHFYMQEAASMLPVALLDPQPGQVILDMSAAPGSKTTFIAARMQSRGVVVANDVQEKRLWTLKHACQRLGVTNAIIVKKVGQWYAKHMTERFDSVLCDAPCTAQGTVRKDSDALQYCSADNTQRMARLQRDLLEAAVHATRVGGRIVYSTCTLTPEENEMVVASILNKFSTQLRVVHPQDLQVGTNWHAAAIEDSLRVQRTLRVDHADLLRDDMPLLRLWPQTYDTEGFFCAVLTKVAPTRDPLPMDTVPFQETVLPKGRQRRFAEELEKRYGCSFLHDGEELFERASELLLTTEEVGRFPLPVQDYALGLPFARRIDDAEVRLNHECIGLRGHEATQCLRVLTDEELEDVLEGRDVSNPDDRRGDVLLRWRHLTLGSGLGQEGVIKNRLSRWLVQRS